MTFWADNIKFIKDVLDSKYKKIEDALSDVSLSKQLILLKIPIPYKVSCAANLLEPVCCKKEQKKFLTSYWFVE